MKYLLTLIILILSPLLISACVLISPIYLTYKIMDRRYLFIERKNGYSEREHKAPVNDLLSFALSMIKTPIKNV